MKEIIDSLNENALFVQAVFTVALFLATVALTWVTARLARSSAESSEATKFLAQESRKSREDANRPMVLARLKPSSDHGDFVRLVVSNVGRGPALELEIRVECDEQDFISHGVTPFRGTSAPIGFMAHGEVDTYNLGAARTLFADPPLQPFRVALEYKDLNGKPHKNCVEINVAQFKGLVWTGASVAWRQMGALERIEKDIVKILRSTGTADIVARYVLAKWRWEYRSGTIEDLPEEYRDGLHERD